MCIWKHCSQWELYGMLPLFLNISQNMLLNSSHHMWYTYIYHIYHSCNFLVYIVPNLDSFFPSFSIKLENKLLQMKNLQDKKFFLLYFLFTVWHFHNLGNPIWLLIALCIPSQWQQFCGYNSCTGPICWWLEGRGYPLPKVRHIASVHQ